jgi:hypothetical protein
MNFIESSDAPEMTPQEVVAILVAWSLKPPIDWLLKEASVHRPKRGRKWIASFRNEHRKQQWKTTRLTDYKLALKLAREWEEQAKRKRASQGAQVKVRTTTGRGPGGLTQTEVAAILRISVRAEREIEHRAIEKLRRHPGLRRLWKEYLEGEIEESACEVGDSIAYQLSFPEIVAMFQLTATWLERQSLWKILDLAQA